jgi:hypothetical protein
MYICMYIRMYTHTHIHAHTHTRRGHAILDDAVSTPRKCAFLCMYACMHAVTSIYTYIIHTHTHIHTQSQRRENAARVLREAIKLQQTKASKARLREEIHIQWAAIAPQRFAIDAFGEERHTSAGKKLILNKHLCCSLTKPIFSRQISSLPRPRALTLTNKP